MGMILLFIVIGISIAVPVKCHEDGVYKTRCLEMRGHLKHEGTELVCELEPGEKK